jgi:hypothetical protein
MPGQPHHEIGSVIKSLLDIILLSVLPSMISFLQTRFLLHKSNSEGALSLSLSLSLSLCKTQFYGSVRVEASSHGGTENRQPKKQHY